MKKQAFFLLTVFLVILSGNLISQPAIVTSTVPLYQDGRLYLKIKAASSVVVKTKDTILNDPGGSFHSLFTKYQVTRTERPFTGLTAGLDKTYRISFTQPTRIDSFLLELSQISSAVDYAEKVSAVRTCSVPNDPVYTNSPTVLYHLPLLNANQASNIHIANGNAIVAIVDNAILTSHDDLMANIGSSVTTWTDVADADNDPNPPLAAGNASNYTHGTMVAGIAGAVTNNSIGIASIGWNNQLMCVKVTPDAAPSNTITNGYDGLVWAAQHGAHVINLSWGGYGAVQTEYNVVAAVKANYDVVLVAGAGNDATMAPFYPAAYGEGTTGFSWEVIDHRLVVAVAALDQNNNRSIWTLLGVFNGISLYTGSNYGYWVDIAAYGTNIYSTMAASTSSGSPVTNQYGQNSGTSLAAPMVSGIAGVMRSYDMTKTADQIIDCLLNTANPDIYGSGHPLNQSGTLGYGRADAYAALRCLSTTCSLTPIAIISASSQSLCPSTTVTLTANQGAGYLWSTGATVQSITVSTSGVYNVTVSYTGSCTATASINIPNADLTPHIDFLENSGLVAGDGIMCGSDAVILYAHWGLSYSWAPVPGSSAFSPGSGGYFTALYAPPYSYTETVTITGVGGCPGITGTASAVMQWIPSPTVTISSTTIPTCPGTAVTVAASGATTYTWFASSSNPYGSPIPSSTVNPYTFLPDPLVTYTVTGTSTNGCTSTQYINSVPLVSPYAQPWPVSYLTSTLSGTYNSIYPFFSIFESYAINSDVTVSGVTTFSNSDVLFGPGVKITVPSGSTLSILGSHLHTCPNDMWQGIVVQDGGALYIDGANGYSTLIEDAMTAVDISNHTTSTLANILTASNTIFNKNYIDVNVANYQRSSSSYSNVIQISNCVFTCRDLPFTPTVWPTPAASSSLDLRFATSSTTGLAPPYLGQSAYSITTLKSPYSGMASHIGIQLNSVGTTSAGSYYGVTIGDASSAGNFNLFDRHGTGISGVNSNITALNNVFQNMVYASSPTATLSQAGTGIASSFSNSIKGLLDLSASSPSISNRFWNCYTSISGDKIYRLGIKNNIFRSTQNATVTLGMLPGNTGVSLYTNKFQYQLMYNEFTNINTAINIPMIAVPTCSICAPGIMAGNLSVLQNTFSAGTGTNTYLNQAVAISFPSNAPLTLTTESISPSLAGAFIEDNVLTNVYRGVLINGSTGWPISVKENTISLVDEAITSNPQHGIDLSNTMSSGQSTNSTSGLAKVVGNQVAGSTLSSNTLVSLFYSAMNIGYASPSFTCNDARNSCKGFVFFGQNAPNASTLQGTHWYANNMQDLAYGMYLSTNGVIGQQGNSSWGMGNTWSAGTSNWPSGTSGIYTYTSNAGASPLYYLNSGASIAPNLFGNPSNVSYLNMGYYNTTVSSQFDCSTPAQKIIPNPIDPIYDSDDIAYLFNTGLYRFLRFNDTIRNGDGILSSFYASVHTGTPSMEHLVEADEYLYAGDYGSARTELSAVTPSNTIETNYKSFYTLYANYQEDLYTGNSFSSTDSTTLYGLAAICPTAGACVYQARALYNAIYKVAAIFNGDCGGGSSARLMQPQNDPQKKQTLLITNWQVELFPNPAANQLSLVCSQPAEELVVTISDLTGRIVQKQSVKPNGFIANLELSLLNGSYVVTITSRDHKPVIKKLLIAE